MRITITGGEGRLGSVIAAELAGAGHDVTALGRRDVDITDRDAVGAIVKDLRPDVIVNCSAYNAVDEAERNPAAAFAVNATGPARLAAEARRISALLVHFSSDFVFDGNTTTPYAENDATNPLSVYGASKLAGEVESARAARHYILRLESNFGGTTAEGRVATIDKIIDNVLAGLAVRAFTDRTVSPSYVVDVARATRALIEGRAPFGVYHCVNSGYSTWYGLAAAIARMAGVRATITPALSGDVKTGAARPRFCALSNRKLSAVGVEMPTWESAVERHLAAREMLTGAAVRR
jgi:dTDP-4-dehydrorhamnose reductase